MWELSKNNYSRLRAGTRKRLFGGHKDLSKCTVCVKGVTITGCFNDLKKPGVSLKDNLGKVLAKM